MLRWKNGKLELAEISSPETVSKEQVFKENYTQEELGLASEARGDFYNKAGVLYFQDSIFVPKKLEKDILRQNHDELLAGHKGTNAT